MDRLVARCRAAPRADPDPAELWTDTIRLRGLIAARQLRLSESALPERCPFGIEEVLDRAWTSSGAGEMRRAYYRAGDRAGQGGKG